MNAFTIADIPRVILALAALALWAWCMILARRLRRLNDLETGLGGAIAVLATEAARLETALAQAQKEAAEAGAALEATVERARDERARWAIYGQDATPPRARLRRARPETTHADA